MVTEGLAHKLAHPVRFRDWDILPARFLRVSDAELQPFVDLWQRQRYNAEGYELSFEQKLKIESAYLVHILGVSEIIARRFHDRDHKAKNMIGRIMGNIDPRKKDYRRFWQNVAEITPKFYTQEYVNLLARSPGMEDLIAIELHATAIFEITAHCYK